MKKLLIITPVKDSIETAKEVVSTICASKGDYRYIVYNDCSTTETRTVLEHNVSQGYELINIEEKISSPSPNYRFTLRDAQKKALELDAGLLIIESDVFVKSDTISKMFDFAVSTSDCGMVAAITVDEDDKINFPYLHINSSKQSVIKTTHRLSFCCTLLHNQFLKKSDFKNLSDKKDWFDVQISSDSRNLGFTNYILQDVRVLHQPHSSRPWKKLKYTNPVKYYIRKWFLGIDKI